MNVDVSQQAFNVLAGPPNPTIGHIRVAPELRVGNGQTAQSVAGYSPPSAQVAEPSVEAPAATSSPAPNFAQPAAAHSESPAGAPAPAGVHFDASGQAQAGYSSAGPTTAAPVGAGPDGPAPPVTAGSGRVTPVSNIPAALQAAYQPGHGNAGGQATHTFAI